MRGRRTGFILLSVLISATLLLTSAAAFAWFARNEALRLYARENIVKFRAAAELAADVASQEIARDANGYDGFDEDLYSQVKTNKIVLGDYEVSFQIRPLDDKIALSCLLLPDGVTVRSEYETAWEKIWEELERPELASIVVDFIDADERQTLGGAEREGNINRLVSDLSELKAIREIDDALLYGDKEHEGGLAKYIEALGARKININIAPPELIEKLDDELTLAHAQSVAAERAREPIKDLDELRRVPGFPAAVASRIANVIGFESLYFRVLLNVRDNFGNERNFRAVVERGVGVYVWEE